ncbi:MAG: SDR family NAD(P)-dependent oxidoreductase [Paracoccaceae bacterium]
MTQPILITGASRGLGAALAEELSSHAPIVAVARTVGGLEALDDRIRARGGEAVLAPMDITVEAAMQQLCRSIYDRWGGARLWVHAAVHPTPLAPAAHIAPKDMARAVAVNLSAVQSLITLIAPLLGARGRAVFFDDPVAGRPFHGSYGASKAGAMALVRSWAAETVKTGPQVRLLTPAPMSTATRARFHPGEDRAALATPAQEAARLAPMILAD